MRTPPLLALFPLLLLSIVAACSDPAVEEADTGQEDAGQEDAGQVDAGPVDAGQDAGWDPSHPRVTELWTNCRTEDPNFFNYRLGCQLDVEGCLRCALLGQPRGGGAPEPLIKSEHHSGGVSAGHGQLPSGRYSHLIAQAGRCESDAGTLALTDELIVELDDGC